jgi:predicted naringenin-chalcone synthase
MSYANWSKIVENWIKKKVKRKLEKKRYKTKDIE